MLTHPTLDQLNAMGLHGMAKAFNDLAANPETDGLGHADWLALLWRDVTKMVLTSLGSGCDSDSVWYRYYLMNICIIRYGITLKYSNVYISIVWKWNGYH